VARCKVLPIAKSAISAQASQGKIAILKTRRIRTAHHASDCRIETNPEQSRKMKPI
jgi:hypothetical protein